MHALTSPSLLEGHVRVRGVVQGVGFRPFVYRLAAELGLEGWVRNDGEGVEIAVRGPAESVNALLQRLESEPPALARVEHVEFSERAIEVGAGFEIRESGAGRADTGISPDAAICPDCLEDLFNPKDRRYRYAFTNCTHCGPRYTITRALPYDRPNTSMAGFRLCPECKAEYHAPQDRRFHAQPNACPECGPRLWLTDGTGHELSVEDPIHAVLELLREGEILAVKGLGGFHLLCDARNHTAVARLRERKAREEKPFAVMFANAASIGPFAQTSADEVTLVESADRPIVLLRKQAGCDDALAGVAPGIAWLGAVLPYTPIHYLLFHEAAGRPAGTTWLNEPQPLALVCTSANPGGEPLVTGNDEALRRLAGIADAFLLHNRDILIRCDDSVVRLATGSATPVRGDDCMDAGGRATQGAVAEGAAPTCASSCTCGRPALGPNGSERTETKSPAPAFLRRARGYTPRAIRLARSGPSVLACGAWFKNTICLTRGDRAFLSQHIGDLDNAPTCTALDEAVDHLSRVLEITPTVVAHDLHPDFYSSRFAAAYAQQHGIPAIPVQHHHAHIAAVLAEHGHEGPALGLALDGVGLGSDGTAWGGELLRVDGAQCERLGHLQGLALPGGDRAAREPWRVAAGVLFALGRTDEIARRWPGAAASAVSEMLARQLNTPHTTSAGRWFDAAAGLLNAATHMSFEGQAAMRLEGLAEEHGPTAPMEGGFALRSDGSLDLLPLLAALAEIDDARYGAALFHATFIEALSAWAARAASQSGITTIALGGGCFLNHILSRGLVPQLAAHGLRVLQARQAPSNDGGIALGQAWVAMHAFREDTVLENTFQRNDAKNAKDAKEGQSEKA